MSQYQPLLDKLAVVEEEVTRLDAELQDMLKNPSGKTEPEEAPLMEKLMGVLDRGRDLLSARDEMKARETQIKALFSTVEDYELFANRLARAIEIRIRTRDLVRIAAELEETMTRLVLGEYARLSGEMRRYRDSGDIAAEPLKKLEEIKHRLDYEIIPNRRGIAYLPMA